MEIPIASILVSPHPQGQITLGVVISSHVYFFLKKKKTLLINSRCFTFKNIINIGDKLSFRFSIISSFYLAISFVEHMLIIFFFSPWSFLFFSVVLSQKRKKENQNKQKNRTKITKQSKVK